MMRIIACLLIGVGAFFNTLCMAQELTVVTEDWRPYNYQDGQEIKGVSTDIVKKVLAQANVKHTISVLPWARAYAMAQENPNTMIYTIIRIPQREKLFKWVRPLGNGGTTSLYRLKSKEEVDPKTIEEAKAFSVVANNDSMDHIWLKDNGFTKLQTPSRVELSLKVFFSGERVDLIAFDDSVMEEEFKKFGYDRSKVVKVLSLFKTPPYMAVSLSTSDEMVTRLQNAYDDLISAKKIALVN